MATECYSARHVGNSKMSKKPFSLIIAGCLCRRGKRHVPGTAGAHQPHGTDGWPWGPADRNLASQRPPAAAAGYSSAKLYSHSGGASRQQQ